MAEFTLFDRIPSSTLTAVHLTQRVKHFPLTDILSSISRLEILKTSTLLHTSCDPGMLNHNITVSTMIEELVCAYNAIILLIIPNSLYA